MSLVASPFSCHVDPIENIPEFRLVKAYLQTLDFVVGTLKEESPYALLPPAYSQALDKVREAVFNLRVEFASSLKFDPR